MAEGGELGELAPRTIEQRNGFLPRHWSHQNPIDMIGDADTDRYAKTVDIAVQDPATDGLLVILAPTGLADPTAIAKGLTHYAKLPNKPVIASWMGGRDIANAEEILNQAGIPTYGYSATAARVFQLMWSYSANLKALYETPEPLAPDGSNAATRAAELISGIRAKGRTLLTEVESKRLLAIYGIPAVNAETAATADQGRLRSYGAQRNIRRPTGVCKALPMKT